MREQNPLMQEDILLIVIRFLSLPRRVLIERVCQIWQRASRLSWRKINHLNVISLFEADDEFMDIQNATKVVTALLQRAGPSLNSLDLSNSYTGSIHLDLNDRIFRAMERHCPNMASLKLCHTNLGNTDLQKIADRCCQLESLTLNSCLEDEESVDVGLACIFQSLRALKHLDLSMNDNLTGECFVALKDILESLKLDRCSRLKLKHMNILTLKCPNIVTLHINNCTQDLSSFLPHFSKLENLSLSGYESKYSISNVFSQLKNLVNLDLSHSNCVRTELLESLAENCSNLESLNISGHYGVTSGAKLEPLKLCTSLKHVDLSWLEHLNNFDIDCIKSNLLTLHCHLCAGISDEAMIRLLQRNKLLEDIDLTGCPLVSHPFLSYAKQTRQPTGVSSELKIQVDRHNFPEESQQSLVAKYQCNKLKIIFITFG